MGYYSTMSLDGEIKSGKEKAFKKAIEKAKAKREKIIKKDFEKQRCVSKELEFIDEFFGDFNKFNIVSSKPKSEPIEIFYLDFDDYCGKFCNDEGFVRFVAPFLVPQDIEFVGEDGVYVGYRIKENGDIVRLVQSIVEDELLDSEN